MDAFPIPIFEDNYVWCLHRPGDDRVVIVDPGDAAPVAEVLAARGLRPSAILITHWHPDHIGGLPALLDAGEVPVYGPAAEAARIPQLSHPLHGGESIDLSVGRLNVLALPGHTLGHIGYVGHGWLFCGDTLFCAGCGRLFEGSPQQMYDSLQKLAALPGETRVACTHEYTLANLRFAAVVEPDNTTLAAFHETARAWREARRPTLPSTLARERDINPFLRCEVPAVRAAAEREAGTALADAPAVFAALRRWKDRFRG